MLACLLLWTSCRPNEQFTSRTTLLDISSHALCSWLLCSSAAWMLTLLYISRPCQASTAIPLSLVPRCCCTQHHSCDWSMVHQWCSGTMQLLQKWRSNSCDIDAREYTHAGLLLPFSPTTIER